MWKINRTESSSISPTPETSRPAPSAPATGQSCIGKGLVIVGEVTGSEPLFIDGRVEGSIVLPGNRVTIGRCAQVTAGITAADIVVMGHVCGNLAASNLLDIRAEASVTGDVSASRLSVEEGAMVQGGVAIDWDEAGREALPQAAAGITAPPKPVRGPHPEMGKLHMHPFPQSA